MAEVGTADSPSPPEATTDTSQDVQLAPRLKTQPVFDLTADLTVPATFFHQPWPSDSRLLDGRPDLRGLPLPTSPALGRSFRDVAGERRGHSQLAVAWFRMTAPLFSFSGEETYGQTASSPLLLIDVDPGSPERGRLIPIAAMTVAADAYTPSNLLAMGPLPGTVMRPNTRYAYVVRRSLTDAAGETLGAAEVVTALLAGDVPPGAEALAPLFAPLAETLTTLGVAHDDVATATVFTTGDSAADLRSLTEALVMAHDATVTDLAVDPFDGAEHDRFCELHGTVSLPQFQQGIPPFETGGRIDLSAAVPAKVRDEQAPVVLTLPHAPMPAAGYPVVVYLHGPDGRATDVVDRGILHVAGGPATRGRGPAWVLAPHGFATLSVALPMNPQRLPGATYGALFGAVNPAAIVDNLRQALIETRLVLEAVDDVTVSEDTVAACDGLSPVPGGYRLDPTAIYVLGDRSGGMLGTMLAAVDPDVRALVTANAGGYVLTLLTSGRAAAPSVFLGVDRWGLNIRPLALHPAFHVAQMALEAADPVVFAGRVGASPLAGMPPRPLLQAVGDQDWLAPGWVLDHLAVASGHPQAGDVVWPELQMSLASAGLDGPLPYPVVGNRLSPDGSPYTSAVVQVAAKSPFGDAPLDPSAILTQQDSLKFQYACFFRSHRETGVAAIVAPQPLGEACPELPP